MLTLLEMLLPLIAVILVIAPLFFIYKKGASAEKFCPLGFFPKGQEAGSFAQKKRKESAFRRKTFGRSKEKRRHTAVLRFKGLPERGGR